MSYDPELFRHDTPPRIFGSETEYATPYDSYRNTLGDYVSKNLVIPGGDQTHLWIKNGGRLYVDCNSIIEYATPECRTPDEVALYEKAGEREVELVTEKLGTATGNAPHAYKRSGYMSVVDAEGQPLLIKGGAGHHENYLTPIWTEGRYARSAHALESYLSTRAIWAGAGIVSNNGYELYQKAHDIIPFSHESKMNEQSSLVQSGWKPLFRNQRENRLEIRSGDGNMSPWAIRTKYGMTSFVLRLIEHEEFPDDLMIDTRRGGLRLLISHIPDATFQTMGHERHTAASYQQAMARACLDFAARYPKYTIPKAEIRAAEDIITVSEDIESYLAGQDNLHDLAVRIDWAAKLLHLRSHDILDRQMNVRNLKAVQYDLQWEQLGGDSASARWYQSVSNTVNIRAVERARRTPPKTRAKDRVDFILSVPDDETILRICYDEVYVSRPEIPLVPEKFEL